MRIIAAPRGLSIAEAEEGGSNRRPLPLHPIPGLLNLHKENQPQATHFHHRHLRLTPHWNRTLISGSSRIGTKYRSQAHLWIGKCWRSQRGQEDWLNQFFGAA